MARPNAILSRRELLSFTASGCVALSTGMGMWANIAAAFPTKGGHLRLGVAQGSTADNLDPGTVDGGFQLSVFFAMHGYLTEISPENTVVGEVAESWKSSKDAAQWRFKIRKGVRFHNGTEVTPQDVITSLDFHRAEDSKSAAKTLVEAIKEIKADGDVVEFMLDAGNADFPYLLSDFHLPILPANGSKADWQSGIGCGSYLLKSFEPGVVARLERNPNGWKTDRAYFDSADVFAIVDETARTAGLKSGSLDVIESPDLKTLHFISEDPELRIEQSAGNMHYTFAMQTDVAPYNNKHLRLALKYAINRKEILEKVVYGYGTIGNDQPIGPANRFRADDIPQREFDLDKARWHFQQSGLGKVSLDLSVAGAAFAGAVDAALLFQGTAAQAGIGINVVREPDDTYWSNVWLKKPFVACYWLGRPVEDMMFTQVYEKSAKWNDTHFDNPRFQKLLLVARSELDEVKRKAIYREMQVILHEEGGVIVPAFANNVWLSSNRIAHAEKIANNITMDGFRCIERWWMT